MPSMLLRRCAERDCGRWLGLRVALRPYRGWIGGVSHGVCDDCCWHRYGIPAPPRRGLVAWLLGGES